MDFGFDGLMKAVSIRLVFNLACNAKNPLEGGVSKEDSCGFFILLNDTIWTLKYYKYMYRIIQKMFFINNLGLSRIIKKNFWQHPSIPSGSHSALPKMADLSIVIIWRKLWWEPEDILQTPLSSFCVEKRKQSKRKVMHDDYC